MCPTSTTRNPLLISELFQCIIDFFLDTPKEDPGLYSQSAADQSVRESQRALAALAQTCRALSEPSLDRLWRRLHSLAPLIRSVTPAADLDRAKVSPLFAVHLYHDVSNKSPGRQLPPSHAE